MTTTRRRTNPKSSRRAQSPLVLHGPLPAPVRLPRVRAALQRIASGYYDRDEVRARLVSAVLAELRRP